MEANWTLVCWTLVCWTPAAEVEVPTDLVRQLVADQHADLARRRTADAMEPDFHGVWTPSIPGFMAFRPSRGRWPRAAVAAGLR